jgi:predicted ATPase with chaperone activity
LGFEALSTGDKKATHPCVCGFLTDPQKEYLCTPLQIQRYRSKVSGPLLDRIDIQVEVPGLRYQELAIKDAGESSAVIRAQVNAARSIQLQRFQKTKIHANAQMGTREIKRYCIVKDDAEKLLETPINKLGSSARAMFLSTKCNIGRWPFILMLSFATIQFDRLFLRCANIRFIKKSLQF